MQQEPGIDMSKIQSVKFQLPYPIKQILDKSQSLLNEGKFYEYEQKINTFGFRFVNNNLAQNAIQLYLVASKELLKRDQVNSGFQLAFKLLELLPAGKLDHNRQIELLSLYSVAAFSQQKIQFINKVLNKFPPQENKQICHQVGVDLMNNQKHYLAWRYLVYTDEYDIQNSLIQKWNETLNEQDRELNLVRYILMQYFLYNTMCSSKLSLGMEEQARQLFDSFKDLFPTPLISLLVLLFKCIFIKSKKGFELLQIKYEPIFSVDPLYKELLSKIGSKYFGIEEQHQTQGVLSNFVSNLLP